MRASTRWVGSMSPQELREIYAGTGYELIRRHFYSPLPDEQDLRGDFYARDSELPGLDVRAAWSLDLAEQLTPWFEEFATRFSVEKELQRYYLLNGFFMAVDAHVYWAFLRKYKPRRIVEIGAGYSTVLAGEACKLNGQELGCIPELVAIDPYPNEILGLPDSGIHAVLRQKVQEVDPKVWKSLEDGDFLFIDSSHVLAAGNDVHFEYAELLPRLKPGVFVHIHDISLPRHYPRSYTASQNYWNEQYLLQAFLAFNGKFDIIWPGNYLMIHHPSEMLRLFPQIKAMRLQYPESEPTSFWIRRKPENVQTSSR